MVTGIPGYIPTLCTDPTASWFYGTSDAWAKANILWRLARPKLYNNLCQLALGLARTLHLRWKATQSVDHTQCKCSGSTNMTTHLAEIIETRTPTNVRSSAKSCITKGGYLNFTEIAAWSSRPSLQNNGTTEFWEKRKWNHAIHVSNI